MNFSPRDEKIAQSGLALFAGLCFVFAIISHHRHKVAIAQAVATSASSAVLVAPAVVSARPVATPILLPLPPLPEVDAAGVRFYLPPGPDRTAGVPPNLRELLREGIRILSAERLDETKCMGKGLGAHRCVGDYILAALAPDKTIQLIDLYEGRPSDPPGFTIALEMKVKHVVGVNMPFVITAPPNWTVLALRTSIGLASKSVTTGKKSVAATEVVNVPYTSRIDTLEVRREGARYLADLAHRALVQLRFDRVKSRLDPHKLVVDTVDVRHIISLIVTEQIYDDEDFVAGDASKRLWMISRELVAFGANHEKAFRYTRSSSNAVGLLQIIPKTRDLLVAAYGVPSSPTPTADPRLDHQQAFELAFFHADDELSTLHHRKLLAGLTNEQLPLALAAGYNCYIDDTVKKALRLCGDRWREELCLETDEKTGETKTILTAQTRRYLKKYEWIRSVLFDESAARTAAEDFKIKPY